MMIAETLPDPNSYAAIGWWCVIAAAVAFGINQIWEMVNRMKGKAPHPPNSQLEADHRALKARVKILEEWKDHLLEKMDGDKSEILAAGEKREERLSADIKVVNGRLDNLNSIIGNLPGEFFAMLANAKNLLGGGK